MPFRSALGLKPRCQFADVMQEGQGSEAGEFLLCHAPSESIFGANSNTQLPYQRKKNRGDIGSMMDKMMAAIVLRVNFSPSRARGLLQGFYHATF